MKETEQKTTAPEKLEGAKNKAALWAGALFCCALWGLAPAMIKTGYALMDIQSTGSIVVFAGLRFFLAGLMVLLFASMKTHRLPHIRKIDLRPICVLALFQTFGQYFFYYLGAAHSSGVMVSVLSGTSALLALLFSALIFRLEKMTLLKLAGCIVGFLGIVWMNASPSGFTFSLSGEGMIFLSQISSALSAVFIQIFSRKSDPVLLSGCQFVLGGAALTLFGFCLPDHGIAWNMNGLLVLTVLAFVSAGAYTLWGVLLSRCPVSSVSVFGSTIGLFGVLFSALILKESLSLRVLYAALLTSLGIAMVNASLPERFRKRKTVPEDSSH